MPRLTDDTRDAILQRWRAGESQNSLAKHYKCAPVFDFIGGLFLRLLVALFIKSRIITVIK